MEEYNTIDARRGEAAADDCVGGNNTVQKHYSAIFLNKQGTKIPFS